MDTLRMVELPEVLLVTSKHCEILDPASGNCIATYKGEDIAPKTLALIDENYIIGAMLKRPCIKVWSIFKSKTVQGEYVFATKGLVNCLAVTSNGMYCIGGIGDEIHTWEVSSGDLLSVASYHFQKVTCLRFSTDDAVFVSGGVDGHVIVWVLSDAIAVEAEKEDLKPYHIWSKHGAAVTDIFCGALGISSRVASTSEDMTCKVYELDSGILLCTIIMDVPLTSVVMDTLEYHVFLGGTNGCLYKVNLYDNQSSNIHYNDTEHAKFQAHDQSIISLGLSDEATKLVSVSEDNLCSIWDIHSMACLLTIPHEEPVTNAVFALRPKGLDAEPCLPHLNLQPFKRCSLKGFQDGRKYQASNVHCTAPNSLLHAGSIDELYPPALLRNTKRVEVGEASVRTQGEEMFQDIFNRETVVELRGINKQLYTYIMKNVMDETQNEE